MFNLEDRVGVFLNPSDDDNEREQAWGNTWGAHAQRRPSDSRLTLLTLDSDVQGFTAV